MKPIVKKVRQQQKKQLKPTPIAKLNAAERKAAIGRRPFSLP